MKCTIIDCTARSFFIEIANVLLHNRCRCTQAHEKLGFRIFCYLQKFCTTFSLRVTISLVHNENDMIITDMNACWVTLMCEKGVKGKSVVNMFHRAFRFKLFLVLIQTRETLISQILGEFECSAS